MLCVRFCYNCGYLKGFDSNMTHECPCCAMQMDDLNLEANAYGHMSPEEEENYRKALLGDKIIPQEVTIKRLEFEAKRRADIKSRSTSGENSQYKPKCSTCGSTNVSKIGTVNRIISTGLLGLGSNKIGKTYKCNKCGTTW